MDLGDHTVRWCPACCDGTRRGSPESPNRTLVSSSECNASWRFFVRYLTDFLDIHHTPPTAIVDRCKGIDNSVSEFLQRAVHSYCAFQTAKRFGVLETALFLISLFGNTNKVREYEDLMASLETKSERALACLATITQEQWVRPFFPFRDMGMSPRTLQMRQTLSFMCVENDLLCHCLMRRSE